MLEFKSAIVNECGEVIAWCDDLTEYEINEILEDHVEYLIECIQIG